MMNYKATYWNKLPNLLIYYFIKPHKGFILYIITGPL